jgi:hypothetical protein
MQTIRFFGIVLMVPVLALLLGVTGCGKTETGDKDDVSGDGGGRRPPRKPKGTTGPAKTELASTGWGTLKGKVTFDGTPPVRADYRETRGDFKTSPDRKVCEMGDTKDPAWVVSADGGVQNVVVWIAPPDRGTYFKRPPEDKLKDLVRPKVELHQPHCAFEPHVEVLYPGYYDYKNKKQVSSGQQFVVTNAAPMKHNTRWAGSPDANPSQSKTLDSGEKGQVVEIQPDKEPITLNCDLHKWMTGYLWAFDHPYAAVTKDDGTFEIKTVPAGADVDIWYWHESFGKNPKRLKKAALTAGTNTEDIKISK